MNQIYMVRKSEFMINQSETKVARRSKEGFAREERGALRGVFLRPPRKKGPGARGVNPGGLKMSRPSRFWAGGRGVAGGLGWVLNYMYYYILSCTGCMFESGDF